MKGLRALSFILLASLAVGCDDLADSLNPGAGRNAKSTVDPELAPLAAEVIPGPPMVRNRSNEE